MIWSYVPNMVLRGWFFRNAPIFCFHNCTGVVESKQHLAKHAPLILQRAGSQRAGIKLVAWNTPLFSTDNVHLKISTLCCQTLLWLPNSIAPNYSFLVTLTLPMSLSLIQTFPFHDHTIKAIVKGGSRPKILINSVLCLALSVFSPKRDHLSLNYCYVWFYDHFQLGGIIRY